MQIRRCLPSANRPARRDGNGGAPTKCVSGECWVRSGSSEAEGGPDIMYPIVVCFSIPQKRETISLESASQRGPRGPAAAPYFIFIIYCLVSWRHWSVGNAKCRVDKTISILYWQWQDGAGWSAYRIGMAQYGAAHRHPSRNPIRLGWFVSALKKRNLVIWKGQVSDGAGRAGRGASVLQPAETHR